MAKSDLKIISNTKKITRQPIDINPKLVVKSKKGKIMTVNKISTYFENLNKSGPKFNFGSTSSENVETRSENEVKSDGSKSQTKVYKKERVVTESQAKVVQKENIERNMRKNSPVIKGRGEEQRNLKNVKNPDLREEKWDKTQKFQNLVLMFEKGEKRNKINQNIAEYIPHFQQIFQDSTNKETKRLSNDSKPIENKKKEPLKNGADKWTNREPGFQSPEKKNRRNELEHS